LNPPEAYRRRAVFAAAPHRMMMFGGALQLVLTLLLWGLELLGRYTAFSAPAWQVPGLWGHGFFMLYTLFTFFIFGFLMTTYPRWMGGGEVPRRDYVRSFSWMIGALPLLYLGLFLHRGLMAAGVAALLVGWLLGLRALWRVYREAPAADKRYETLLNLYLAMAALGMLIYGVGLLSNSPMAYGLAMLVGLWGFLVPLLFTVAHRMLPFFSGSVLESYQRVQPFRLLQLMVAAAFLRLLLSALGAEAWLLLADLPLLLASAWLSLRWGLARSFVVPLLAVLHIAFLWLPIGMALFVVQDLARLLSMSIPLGQAPLHALGIGFVTGMTIAMATRVTLGHSGRELRLDAFTAWLYAGVNLAALLRILAELPGLGMVAGLSTNLLAAGVWLLCLLPWALRYGWMYWTPRVDGRGG
jgi:uncharacterized protein involved in response to NO